MKDRKKELRFALAAGTAISLIVGSLTPVVVEAFRQMDRKNENGASEPQTIELGPQEYLNTQILAKE